MSNLFETPVYVPQIKRPGRVVATQIDAQGYSVHHVKIGKKTFDLREADLRIAVDADDWKAWETIDNTIGDYLSSNPDMDVSEVASKLNAEGFDVTVPDIEEMYLTWREDLELDSPYRNANKHEAIVETQGVPRGKQIRPSEGVDTDYEMYGATGRKNLGVPLK